MLGFWRSILLLLLLQFGALSGAEAACGFPDSFDKLRLSLADVVTFRDLQKDRRLGILRARLRNIDHAELDRAVRAMGLGHRINEIQQLMFIADGVSSGMARVDRDALERRLLRLDRMEGQACSVLRHIPGLERPGSEWRLLWVFSLFAALVWAVLRLRPQVLAWWHEAMQCRVPAVLHSGAARVEIELIEISRVGCRAVPDSGDLRDWKQLMGAGDALVIEIGALRLVCRGVALDSASVAFAFAETINPKDQALVLAASRTRPRRSASMAV